MLASDFKQAGVYQDIPIRFVRPEEGALEFQPVFPYCQKITAKSGAKTLLECNGLPVLVTGRCGKGRVAVFAGTYLGEAAPGNALFYEWSGYPELLTRVSQWLLNK